MAVEHILVRTTGDHWRDLDDIWPAFGGLSKKYESPTIPEKLTVLAQGYLRSGMVGVVKNVEIGRQFGEPCYSWMRFDFHPARSDA